MLTFLPPDVAATRGPPPLPATAEEFIQQRAREHTQAVQARVDQAVQAIALAVERARIPVPVGAHILTVALNHKWPRGSAGADAMAEYRLWERNLQHVVSGEWRRSEEPILRRVYAALKQRAEEASELVTSPVRAEVPAPAPTRDEPDAAGVNNVAPGAALDVLFSELGRISPPERVRDVGNRLLAAMQKAQWGKISDAWSYVAVWITPAGLMNHGIFSRSGSMMELLLSIQADRTLRAKSAKIVVFPVTPTTLAELPRAAERGAALAERRQEKEHARRADVEAMWAERGIKAVVRDQHDAVVNALEDYAAGSDAALRERREGMSKDELQRLDETIRSALRHGWQESPFDLGLYYYQRQIDALNKERPAGYAETIKVLRELQNERRSE